MTRYLSSLCIVVLLFSLLACSGKQPPGTPTNTNAPNPPAQTGPAAYEGFHDIASCDEIVGWAWDKNRPDEPIKIDIFDDTKLIASVTADWFRQDLQDDHKGNGKHGFVWAVPPALRDGKSHSIGVKIAGSSIDLGNTPKDMNCK